MSIILISFIAFLPAIIWGVFSIKHKVPIFVLVFLFFTALLAIPICNYLQWYTTELFPIIKNNILFTLLQQFFIASFIEESIKLIAFYVCARFLLDFFAQKINNPDASVGAQCSMFRTVCSHKVVAVGFNTLCYDAERRGIKPSARITSWKKEVSSLYHSAIFFGLCFGGFETISYGIRFTAVIWIRLFTAVLLHGTLAAFYVSIILHKSSTILLFLAAVFLHGLYNVFSGLQGLFTYCSFAVIYFSTLYAYHQIKNPDTAH